ncbi:MAG: adenylosuccinate synthetase, partial [Thermoanaerobaculia bacterium]
DTIALTKIDVLDDLEEVKVCTGYLIDGEEVETVPASAADWERAEPIYRTVEGWKQTTVGTLRFEDLPRAAQSYVELIETEVGAPVSIVSTGPRREETILRSNRGLESLTSDRVDRLRAELG